MPWLECCSGMANGCELRVTAARSVAITGVRRYGVIAAGMMEKMLIEDVSTSS